MNGNQPPTPRLTLCSLTLLLCAAAGSGYAAEAEPQIGADEYRASCASCHGLDGKGDGPIASILMTKPADLTVIAKNSVAQYPYLKAGEYPFYRVFQIIDGRTLVSGHGERTMPVWGNRYALEIGLDYGPQGAEKAIRGRILELVYYIQSIQER